MTARPMQYEEGLLASPVLQRIIERIPACIARAALPLWFRGEGFSSFPFRINDVGCDQVLTGTGTGTGPLVGSETSGADP